MLRTPLELVIRSFQGSVNDDDLVERKLREEAIEVVISVMGGAQILDQLNLLKSIKAVGSIKVASLQPDH